MFFYFILSFVHCSKCIIHVHIHVPYNGCNGKFLRVMGNFAGCKWLQAWVKAWKLKPQKIGLRGNSVKISCYTICDYSYTNWGFFVTSLQLSLQCGSTPSVVRPQAPSSRDRRSTPLVTAAGVGSLCLPAAHEHPLRWVQGRIPCWWGRKPAITKIVAV